MKKLYENLAKIENWKLMAYGLGTLFLIFSIFDFFNLPTYFKMNELFIKSKDIIYFTMAAALTLLVYYSQNSNSDKHNEQLQKKINQIFPLTKNAEIFNKVKDWMTRDKSNTQGIVFYFPYSIIPGFWVQPRLFDAFLELFDLLNKNNPIKILFIGPNEKDYNFKTILESVTTFSDKNSASVRSDIQTNIFDNKFIQSRLGKYINITDIIDMTFTDESQKVEHIKNEIRGKYSELLIKLRSEQKTRCHNVFLHEVDSDNDQYWKNKPPFSIIIRCKRKDKSFEAIITDTFNIVKDFNASILFNGSNNDAMFKPEFSKLREDPNNYEFQNQDITNLFVNNLLLTLESDVINKLKNITQ